ncbi:MAG: ABC transporter ATP-binding protein [Chloroflexota bacterium]
MMLIYRNMMHIAGSMAGVLRASIIITMISALVQGITFAMLYPLFKELIYPRGDGGRQLLILGSIFIILVLIDAALRFVIFRYDWESYIKAGYELRIKLGTQMRNIPLESLIAQKVGELNVVLSGHVDYVIIVLTGLYNIVLYTIIAPLITLLITFFIDWRLALALAVIFPFMIPIYRNIRAVAARGYHSSAAAHEDVTSNLIEYAQGLAVLRSTRQVGAQSVRLQASLDNLLEKQSAAQTLKTVPNLLISTLVQVGILVVTLLGLLWVVDGSLNVAIMLALFAIMVRYSETLAMFGQLATMFDIVEASLARIDDLLAIEPLPVKQPQARIERFEITFSDVDFEYAADGVSNEGGRVLHDISFTLPERSLTALVGPSGSGKTTITKLITRFADPQNGAVKIGGVDIHSLEQVELMQHISVVFQDVYLFDDSIRNNIRMARPTATDAEVEAAAEAANCHEFITRLPDGYNTTVGEIGGALSGGERQRISIARAILKDAPIVLLDEPTSALDTESEVAVQRAIDKLVADKTVVVIAHRLSTVVAADQILVLEDGRLVECGGHDDLLAVENGRYSAMWAAQQQARRWKV